MLFFQKNIVDDRANPYALAAFRIVFSLIGLCYAIRSLEFVGLIASFTPVFFLQEMLWRWNEVIYYKALMSAYFLWIFLLVFILVGVGGKLLYFIHFIVAVLLLDFNPIKSVQETVYLLPSFWMIFMRLNDVYALDIKKLPILKMKQRSKSDLLAPAWPVYLFLISFGVMLFSAGLLKGLDVFWVKGIGFYLTFLLPWIKPDFIKPMLDIKPFVFGMNHIAIISECGFIFCLISKKLRWLCLIIVFGLFGQLAFLLRLDFIGLVGLTYLFPVLSVINVKHATSVDGGTTKTLARSSLKIYFDFMVAWIVFFTSFHLYRALMSPHSHPSTLPVENMNSSELSESEESKCKYCPRRIPSPMQLLDYINRRTVRAGGWALFTSHHYLGIYEYRVKVHYGNSDIIEPVSVQREDKNPGLYTLGFVPRYLHGFNVQAF